MALPYELDRYIEENCTVDDLIEIIDASKNRLQTLIDLEEE